jgi:predicted metal-dependent hydrolase
VSAEPLPAIEYSVRRSKRARRSRITILDDAAVVVVLPMRAAEREAPELVRRHRAWIERHVVRITNRRRTLALRPSLANGRVLTINGQPEIVRAITDDERAALERRLRRTARAALLDRLAVRAPEMAITFKRVTVRDQRTRWGSASRTGTLSFNWRLILCPPTVLDYVVVHELAHLKVSGHGPAFWRVVRGYYPDPARARKWLRDHHDEIRNALD